MTQLILWLSSGSPRLVAVGVLFLLMWALKHAPLVRGLLTTPRRKQAAVAFLAMSPAVWLMAGGAPFVEVFSTALLIAFAANGLNTYRPSKT